MTKLTALVVPLAVATLMGASAAAQAQPAQAGPDFGQHVLQCAKTMGFNGSHNPGMHHGASGWDGVPC